MIRSAEEQAVTTTLLAHLLKHHRPPFQSRRHIERCVASGLVQVNDTVRIQQHFRVCPTDTVSILATHTQMQHLRFGRLPLAIDDHVEEPTFPENFTFHLLLPVVRYELNSFVVLEKPAGLPLKCRQRFSVANALSTSLATLIPSTMLSCSEPVIVASVGRPISGPILVALSTPAAEALSSARDNFEMQFVFRLIVHGNVSEQYQQFIDNLTKFHVQRGPTKTNIVVKRVIQSTGGPLSEIDLSTSYGDTGLRKLLAKCGFPVLGNSTNSRLSRGRKKANGIFMACTQICFPFMNFFKDGTNASGSSASVNDYVVDLSVPSKFGRVLDREHRFWVEKKAREEHQQARLNDQLTQLNFHRIPSTLAVHEEIRFVEFDRVPMLITNAVMAPCTSSELLVQLSSEVLHNICKSNGKDRYGNIVVVGHKLGQKPVSPRVLDLGTGSGALLIAIILRTKAYDSHGTGIDISKEALDVASTNVKMHGLEHYVELVSGDFGNLERVEWVSYVAKSLENNDAEDISVPQPDENFDHSEYGFDVIVCNPPYLTQKEYDALSDEHLGPSVAMLAAKDRDIENGYSSYFSLSQCLQRNPHLLNSRGRLIVEVGGRRSASYVVDLFERFGILALEGKHFDAAGFCRCLVFSKKVPSTS